MLTEPIAQVDFAAMLAPIALAIAASAAAIRARLAADAPAIGRSTAEQYWRALAIVTVAYSISLRLLYFGQISLMPEETYYWNYSRHLDIGYLDHPPVVAWLIHCGTAWLGDTEAGVRIGALVCGGIASYFIYGLTRNLFDARIALIALALAQILPFFFLSGMLMTPDAPLTAAWSAALYFLERALIAERGSAWWAAGICLGIGLLSKYTIGLLVPATLIFVMIDPPSRRWLGRIEPYAAAAIALAIFSPVIIWNAQHEWASFVFQTTRRLAERPRFSLHKLIAATLVLITPTGAAAVAAALGARASAAVVAGPAVRRRRFLQSYVLVPLAVFALFSLRHDVKLDWTGETWIAALPPVAAGVASYAELRGSRALAWIRAAWAPTILALTLIYGAGFYHLVRGLPDLGYSKHMELLPVGWRDFGRQIGALRATLRAQQGEQPLVVGMDRYALASELAFYAPDQAVAVANTSSDQLFGGLGLMYEFWFPQRLQVHRTMLLIAWNPGDLVGPSIESRAQRLDPVHAGTVAYRGKFIRHYYFRTLYDYRPAPLAD